MSILQAIDLSKSYGDQDVLRCLTLSVSHQDRIALVGPNGVGKSTLLRILAGVESPDQGSIQRPRSLQIGYLPQATVDRSPGFGSDDQTPWEIGLEAFRDLRSREMQLAELESSMADPQLVDQAMTRYGALQEAFERDGGYIYQARIRQVLSGLGFSIKDDFHRPLSQLSGGERTRLQFARLLLEDPDLLILDEPTNHLDIEAIEWLERWLRDWPGSVMVVSHDRFFLDRVANTVWDLTPTGLETYRGNYSAYAQQRTERVEHLSTRFKAQQEHIRKERDYIQRNIAGQNTRQAQGRQKRLDRMLRDEEINLQKTQKKAHIAFNQPDRSGDLVLRTQDLVVGFREDDQALFNVPDITLRRGECVALIGPNGSGKTTLLKTLLEEVKPFAGEVHLGASLQLGYFEQAHDGMQPERTALEDVMSASPDLTISKARSLLGGFLFSGDEVKKTMAVLSGGERGRVALLKLILQGANFLLLDEPTNHLDIPSQEALQDAIRAFPGTILLVSHDRYLVQALASQVWVISTDERSLRIFPYGYQSYLDAREQEREKRSDKEQTSTQTKSRSKKRSPKAPDINAIETRIVGIETEMTQVSLSLEHAGTDMKELVELGEKYASLEAALEVEMQLWEQAARGQAPT
ncbi:MAG: ATP-binding cassette domain-containing protein [Anaerolineales bacterium]|nr:ATP-binding cassette domain-containing protein [Anaerolineales bacterium]